MVQNSFYREIQRENLKISRRRKGTVIPETSTWNMTRIFYSTWVKPACCVSKISSDGGCQSKETGVGMEVRLLSVGARVFFSPLRDSPSRLRRSILSTPKRKTTSGTQGISSLAWRKSLPFCTCTHPCACADDVESCAVGMRNAILRNDLKSRAPSHKPSSDCVIAHAKGRVRAQASYGNITVLSHLKWFLSYV